MFLGGLKLINEQHLRKEIHKFTSSVLSQMSEEQLNKLSRDLQEDSDMLTSSTQFVDDSASNNGVPSYFITSSGRIVDDSYEGGLWVSPQGKAYEVTGDHSEYILEYPSLFGIDVSGFESDDTFGLDDSDRDVLYEQAYSKGWARVRIVDGDIFVDVIRSINTDRFLSKVVQCILDYGVPYDSAIHVEVLEDSGQYSNSNESLSSLLTSRYSAKAGLFNVQAKWIQGLLTREEAIAELVKTGKSREIANKILDSWGTRFSSYTPLHSGTGIANLIISSPDKDYEVAKSGTRYWLDGVCKRIQSNLGKKGIKATISPITNLTWRVVVGQKVVFQVIYSSSNNVDFFDYTYFNASGKSFSGQVRRMEDLKGLISKVGV